MVKLIGTIVIAICVVSCVVWLFRKLTGRSTVNSISVSDDTPFSSLSENELVKKFNKFCDDIMGTDDRGVDHIANKMLAILKEYKCRKIEQFVESSQMLEKNKKHLNAQIGNIETQIQKLKSDAKALANDNMTDDDYELGAMYMAQIDESQKLKDELIKTAKENDEQLERVDRQVKSFNTKYALKEASITNMIVKAKAHCNFSNVDLKLNDLITEFNDKVSDIEVEQRVRAQVANRTEEDDTPVDFNLNKADYIAKFKEMINK